MTTEEINKLITRLQQRTIQLSIEQREIHLKNQAVLRQCPPTLYFKL